MPNPGLDTQQADTVTAGADFAPAFLPGLAIKAGYYRIRIKGRVVTPSQEDAATLADLQRFNLLSPGAGQIDAIINNPTTFRWFAANVPFINDGESLVWNAASEIPPDLISQVQAVIDIRPQNFAVEFTDGIDLDLSLCIRAFWAAPCGCMVTGQYILTLDLRAGSGAPVSLASTVMRRRRT